MKPMNAFAIVRQKRFIRDEEGLCGMLVFDKKWRAENARKDGENVIPVRVVPRSQKKVK